MVQHASKIGDFNTCPCFYRQGCLSRRFGDRVVCRRTQTASTDIFGFEGNHYIDKPPEATVFFIYFVHVTSTTIKISGGPVTFMSNAHCCYVTRGVNYLLSTLCTIPDNEGVVQQYEYTPPLLSEKSLASFDTHTHVAHRTTSGRYRSGGTYHESSLSALNYFK